MLSDGQVANQGTFNDAFMSRTVDTSTVGKVDLQNVDADSGPDVLNAQRELNGLAAFVGRTVGAAFDLVPVWANNYVGLITDHVAARVDALVALFSGTAGHAHTGVDGDGPEINTADLASDTTESTDKDTGCLILDGGLGVEKSINAGGTIHSVGNMSTDGNLSSTGDASVGGDLAVTGAAGIGGALVVTGNASAANLSGTNTGDQLLNWVPEGTRASPTNVTAAGGIVAPTSRRSLKFVKGNTAGVNISANPQIAAGSVIGQELTLRVPDGENGIYFENGTGLSQNGDFTLGVDCFSATYVWDGTEWFLKSRD